MLVVGIAVRAAHPLMWFLEAAVIAALAWPVVQRLGRYVPAWVAVLLLTGAVAVVVGAIGAAGFTELQHEAGRFRDSVPAAAHRLEAERPLGGLLEDLHVGDQLAKLGDQMAARFELGGDLPGLASAVGGGASATFVVWVLSVMLVFAGPGMVDSALGVVPGRAGGRLGPAVRDAYGTVLRYLAWTSVRAVAMGVGVYLVALALDIHLPALLAAMAALAAFVPYVGVAIGILPLALLAVLNGTGEALAVLLGGVAAQVLDSLVVQPRIDRVSFRLGTFPTIVAAMLGISLYGVIGLFVGLTVGALAFAVLQHLDADQARWERSSLAATSSSTEAGGDPDAIESSTDSSSSPMSET